MKFTFIALILLSFELHADYSKKIILASFKNLEDANKALNSSFVKIKTYNEVENLAKTYSFTVHIRESGKYVVLVAEPFYEKKVLKKVLKLLKPYYKNAYYNNYTPQKIEKIDSSTKEEVAKKSSQPLAKSEEKIVKATKESPLKQESSQTNTESIVSTLELPKRDYDVLKSQVSNITEKAHQESTEVFKWYYIVFFIFIAVIFHFIIKFRKMYEEF